MKRQPVFIPIDISPPNIGGTLSSASHFYLIKSPSGINQAPPPNDALKPLDGTIQTKKRFGYPNRFCIVSTKKHRSESERCLVREMGLEPTHKRFGILFEFSRMTNYSHLSAIYVLYGINAIRN